MEYILYIIPIVIAVLSLGATIINFVHSKRNKEVKENLKRIELSLKSDDENVILDLDNSKLPPKINKILNDKSKEGKKINVGVRILAV